MNLTFVYSITILLLLHVSRSGLAIGNFVSSSEYVCSGSQVVYECTAEGAGATLWFGNAFQCSSSNRITLLHSDFSSQSGTFGTCNDGAIIAQSLRNRNNNNNFVSELNVITSSKLDGKTITCAHDNGITTTIIGTSTVNIAKDPLPPPSNILLSDVSFGRLIFNWNSVSTYNYCQNCSIHYNTISNNCGVCRTTTVNNSVICEEFTVGNNSVCTLSMQTVLCSNISGSISLPTSVLIKAPRVPSKFFSIPRYSAARNTLTHITSTFVEEEYFAIFNDIDGSATSYTINYFESITGNKCSSAFISPSSCVQGICQHVLDISLSRCTMILPLRLGITAFATNLLGNGLSTDPIFIAYTNQFVNISVSLSTMVTFTCTFLNQQLFGEKSCSVVYNRHQNCTHLSKLTQEKEISVVANTLDTLTIDLLSIPTSCNESETNTLCYTATAVNNNFTIEIEGNFSEDCQCDPSQLGDTYIHVPDDVNCKSMLHSIGQKNGVVCYNGTAAGSIAIYHCLQSDLTLEKIASVRICQINGEWNGTVHHCQFMACNIAKENNIKLVISIISLGLINIAVILITIITVIILAKAKAKLQKTLNEMEHDTVIYEDIAPPIHNHSMIQMANTNDDEPTITVNAAYDI